MGYTTGKTEYLKKSVINLHREIVTVLDSKRRVLWANPALSRKTGLPAEEILGRDCKHPWLTGHIEEEDCERCEPCPGCPVVAAFQTGEREEAEIDHGDLGVYSVVAVPVEENRRIGQVVELAYDISGQKQREKRLDQRLRQYERLLQEAEQPDIRTILQEMGDVRRQTADLKKLKNRLISNISHEMRTPLNGVLGFAGILKNSLEDDETTQYAEMIERSGHRLLEIVDSLLMLSKMNTRKIGSMPTQFNLRSLFEKIQQNMREKGRLEDGTGVEVRWEGEEERVYGNPGSYQMILQQLADNAVKFTRQGRVVMTGTVHPTHILLRVDDSGPGINREDRERIFEPFYQGPLLPEQREQGIGVGLTLVKGLVKQMGGEIKVAAPYDGGSRFTVYLPNLQEMMQEEGAEWDTMY